MTSLLFVVGTRPEAIKIGPVVAECKRRGISHDILHTGQHTDLLLGTGLEPTIHCPALPNPPRDKSPEDVQAWMARELRRRLLPHIQGPVVVQGDTISAYIGAALAYEDGWQLVHIEAGVRTYQFDPWPEEGYRTLVDKWADIGLCATEGNLSNLIAEGCHGQHHVTGNPGVDACLQIAQPHGDRHPLVLVTLHRRESHGPILQEIVHALSMAAGKDRRKWVWPVHPNPAVQAAAKLAGNIQRVAPMPYERFLAQLATAQLVITDSGGVQEDAATLGIPCVIARDHTDRPESVESGHALIGGRTRDSLTAAIAHAHTLRMDPSTVFGDGQAAPRIADHLEALLD